jgi:hypothetical protein
MVSENSGSFVILVFSFTQVRPKFDVRKNTSCIEDWALGMDSSILIVFLPDSSEIAATLGSGEKSSDIGPS